MALQIRALAGGEVIDLVVYGYLADAAWMDDETGALQIRQFLDEHPGAKRINVRINSHGGSAFAGVAIRAALVAHPAEVVVTVEGLAGSAASLVAMAGDRVIMALGAMIMIHAPSALAAGPADELRKVADILDQVETSILEIYHAKTGLPLDQLAELVSRETWMTAAEALQLGFADEVEGHAAVEQRGDLLVVASVGFRAASVPESLLALLAHPEPEPEPAPLPEPEPELTREIVEARAPALVAALLAEGERRERERHKAIDSVALPGHAEAVARARYQVPISAETLAIQILQAERQRRSRYLADAALDAADAAVQSAPPPEASNDEEGEIKTRAAALAAAIGRAK